MNIQRVKDIGGILAVIVAAWAIWDKIDLPDTIAPATVGYVNGKVEPLEAGNKNDARNWAVRNLAYYFDKLCQPGLKSDRKNELREEIAKEYANFLWATGRTHVYSTMSENDVCNERKE